MKITYEERGNNVFTNVSYADENGVPMYSRFGEYMTKGQVENFLAWARKNDRNAK